MQLGKLNPPGFASLLESKGADATGILNPPTFVSLLESEGADATGKVNPPGFESLFEPALSSVLGWPKMPPKDVLPSVASCESLTLGMLVAVPTCGVSGGSAKVETSRVGF